LSYLTNPYRYVEVCVKGGVIESETPPNEDQEANLENILWSKMVGLAVVGECYDQIAMLRTTVSESGNFRQAVYDDLSGVPNALLGETASVPVQGTETYNFIATTAEFEVTTTQLWGAFQQDTGGQFWKRKTGTAAGTMRYRVSYPYGVFPASAGSGSANGSFIQKIGHS